MQKLRTLDLFSGIGGFSLGLERTGGFETVAFCEIEPFCQRVLAKHWPEVPIYDDVRKLTAAKLDGDGVGHIDVICGGFPCQDVSTAGKRAGLAGARSGLWSEYARLVGELRPRYVLVENTPGLLSLGMGDVLGQLATLRYDAEWESIPLGALGAHHERDRVWILAYPNGEGEPPRPIDGQMASLCGPQGDAARAGRAHPEGKPGTPGAPRFSAALAAAYGARGCREWPPEPDVVRVVDGISDRTHGPRIKALGNAVGPDAGELVGEAVLIINRAAAMQEAA
jgi:DNA (cytosine-5)-methyltransferase 1